jgi:ABC-2 type transport system ATP-binding protein
MIQVDHLVRSYGKFKAVNDVSFGVGKGQIVGLLGPNGAGKTTLLKMLTGYHFPQSGDIRIGGIDIVQQPQKAQALIGYLPENSPVYPELTVGEYLEFVAGVRGIDKALQAEAIDKALTQTDALAFRNKVASHLSKGQRQRVGLAQAILHNPEILILDEPTSGLDPHQILEFRQLILKIGQEKTVILSTHIMQEVEALCERVLIMNQGKIVAEGRAEEIARSLQGGNRYEVRFSGAKVEAVAPLLEKVAGLSVPPALTGETFLCTFPLDIAGGEALFDFAVAQKLKLISLVPRTISLEDLFVQLTKEETHAVPAEPLA